MSSLATPGTPPTRRELQALALQLRFGGKEAAHRLGIHHGTMKNLASRLYSRLEVDGAFAAAEALGWLTLPAEIAEAIP